MPPGRAYLTVDAGPQEYSHLYFGRGMAPLMMRNLKQRLFTYLHTANVGNVRRIIYAMVNTCRFRMLICHDRMFFWPAYYR